MTRRVSVSGTAYSLPSTLTIPSRDRRRDAFSAHYYAAPQEALDTAWTPNDPKSDDAQHVPVALPYDERLATFRDFREVMEPIMLSGDSYTELARRIRIRAS